MKNGAVAEMVDQYGEKRKVHKTRHGWKLMREQSTVVLHLAPIVGAMIGAKIKERRVAAGITLAELALRAGLKGTPKCRMWEIENNVRPNGVRVATLFALARVLHCEARDLLPTVDEVLNVSAISESPKSMLELAP